LTFYEEQGKMTESILELKLFDFLRRAGKNDGFHTRAVPIQGRTYMLLQILRRAGKNDGIHTRAEIA
jgi:hypothetical protein